MNEIEQQIELQRLEMVLQQIRLKLDQGAGICQTSHNELQDALAAYWESPGKNFWDQVQLTESVERQRNLTSVSYRRQSQFVKMASSPYFGRIDFVEAGFSDLLPSEVIYIGITTLTDSETGEYLIYDWRSPVAAMFYVFERGKSHYQCPAGTISGEITLKRQYKIKNGQMEYMFDADLKIDDEMLQEILGKSVDDKMRTIVNTIQREQNYVIRDEQHRFLLVQGTADSGKTSIALHRIAYILYRERNLLTARNILIFSPNQIFSDYISNVLPELGEDNVLQTTFKDFVHNSKLKLPFQEIEDGASQLEYILIGSDEQDFYTRVAGIRYKSSPEFVTHISHPPAKNSE
jgi:DNA helicase-2/ATP-dependent DNA helicase PcrA